MNDDKTDTGLDRRTFLKSAAAAGATVAAAGTFSADAAAQETKSAGKAGSGARAAQAEKALPGDIVIGRPGSDFMVDVLKTLDLEYVAANPASSFRSLHESLINYGGNKMPEFITCLHEETSVGIAHGYAKAAGKPMMAMAHASVGLQHAAMAVYNAWCDRVPVFMVAGNGADAPLRRNATEGCTRCRTRRRWSAISSSGTISRLRCSTSPSRRRERIGSRPRRRWSPRYSSPTSVCRKRQWRTKRISGFRNSRRPSRLRASARRSSRR